jgi:parallel beta-helix repeat protein
MTSLCGVSVRDNRAGAIGGGLFRVSNTEDGALAVERSTISGNRIPVDAESSLAGGMYLQGLAIRIRASTVSDNEAGYNGGIWLGQGSTVEMVNSTIAGNRALEFHGGGIWLAGSPSGTILNCTVAGNGSTGDDGLAAAIFGEGPDLVLKNTIIDGQVVGNPYSAISCDQGHGDGGGNAQWPVEREAGGSDDPDALCAAGALVADPRLGEMGDNGGPTPTAAPAADSPAIGLGTDCPETDQRGEPRGEPCTSGAVEVE